MTDLLLIKAHPLTIRESRSLKTLDVFLQTYKDIHPDHSIEMLDLYNTDLPEIDEELLSAWGALRTGVEFTSLNQAQQRKVTLFDEMSEQFLQAKKIVIANALWNLNVPTRLKAWIDTINVAGKTFKYTENGPVGLVEGKKVLHIQSNGGFYNGTDFSAQYVKGIMNFIGINDVSQIFIEGIDHQPEKAEEILEDVYNRTRKIAQSF